jgi:hypothetical protein
MDGSMNGKGALSSLGAPMPEITKDSSMTTDELIAVLQAVRAADEWHAEFIDEGTELAVWWRTPVGKHACRFRLEESEAYTVPNGTADEVCWAFDAWLARKAAA